MKMIFTPVEVMEQIFEFLHGEALQNKRRLIHQIKLLRVLKELDDRKRTWTIQNDSVRIIDLRKLGSQWKEHIQYEPKHYSRRDNEWVDNETFYMEELLWGDYPRNQLLLYKKYVKQLEQKVKQLETKLERFNIPY